MVPETLAQFGIEAFQSLSETSVYLDPNATTSDNNNDSDPEQSSLTDPNYLRTVFQCTAVLQQPAARSEGCNYLGFTMFPGNSMICVSA